MRLLVYLNAQATLTNSVKHIIYTIIKNRASNGKREIADC